MSIDPAVSAREVFAFRIQKLLPLVSKFSHDDLILLALMVGLHGHCEFLSDTCQDWAVEAGVFDGAGDAHPDYPQAIDQMDGIMDKDALHKMIIALQAENISLRSLFTVHRKVVATITVNPTV